MKTKLFCLLGCLFLALTFTSCSDDEVGSANTLVGGGWQSYSEEGWEKEDGVKVDEWKYFSEEEEEYEILYFFEDGTYKLRYNDYGRWYEEYGTWSVQGKRLILLENGETEDEGETIIKTLNSTTLVVEHTDKYEEDGVSYEEFNRLTYHRVSDDD